MPTTTREHDPELLVPAVAEELGICKETVLRAIRSGRLRAMRIGRGYRIRASWIDEYRENATVAAP
ncbi:helix-turn-helix domain-containing protein [Mycobacterium sp. OTB74]|jgi:excisionase family DNA binding protein|uniref:helix-turn-helix domain-containing protein n=1 Tax=Mycobacterium sp. OTB74 TaxID=1853452 RepID=UPI002472F1C5|nr:helix-turn-helix domain-containing protein [Mycobacterium sp. OTB74]MDH6245536.1 excisionase family DNA binding protein [Mycobacterium sp. OTB74]